MSPRLALASLTLLGLFASSTPAAEPFLVKPYLQLGPTPAPGALRVLWHSTEPAADWTLEYQGAGSADWTTAKLVANPVAVKGVAPHHVVRADVVGLTPGESFAYRLKKANAEVFTAKSVAPKKSGQASRFAVFGDCGADTPAQRAVAVAVAAEHPDYLMITGDIVYSRGRISEYAAKFWPIYNAETADPALGAPLLRSILFTASAGNHDIGTRDLDKYPDTMAYFHYWDQPRTGPDGKPGSAVVGRLVGSAANVNAFLASTAGAFPKMANFSFDYGDAHWTVIDANEYVDWKSPEARGWLERDLAAAKGAKWRFVSFHHPGFNSSKAHFDDQRTRVLAPIFEAGKVDVVFTGHVHNYQRTFPLRFVPDDKPVMVKSKSGAMVVSERVNGVWSLDKTFDGKTDTTPEGVVYLVTGAGGQSLYNPEQQDDPKSWQEFTDKFVSKINTFTVVDLDGAKMTVRQLGADGKEVDHFVLTK